MSESLSASEADALLLAKLNAETGRLGWAELQRHFARGVVIKVAAGTDLIAVAAGFSRDDKTAVTAWLQAGQVQQASTEDAQRWHAQQAIFWAIVVAPWVLVQEISE